MFAFVVVGLVFTLSNIIGMRHATPGSIGGTTTYIDSQNYDQWFKRYGDSLPQRYLADGCYCVGTPFNCEIVIVN